jgi:CRISPR-associated exonuclease Cas4
MTDGSPARAVALTGLNGYWTPFPIDYKRGRPKANSCDEVQLCAQALCLEEMLDVLVPEGALFYGRRKRRHRVLFDEDLRIETEQRAGQLRRLLESGNTPRAGKTSKCGNCSLINECLPESMGRGKSARRYLDEMTRDVRTDDETGIP